MRACVHHCPLNGLLYMSLPFADHDTHQRSPLPHWTGGQQNTGQVGEPWPVYCGGALTHTTLTALHLTTPSLHSTLYHHPHTPLPSLQEERIAMAANEVRSLLRILDNQTYACRSVEALQKLRRTLTEMCSDFSNSLYNTPSLANYGRKRSASTKDTPALKKTA